MPETGKRVLVFDNDLKLWKIAKIEERQGVKWWVFDPHIYVGITDRYSDWQDLPGNPR